MSAPSWRHLVAVFGRIGVLSFGGPAAQIGLMHRVLVEEERWLDERAFLNALGFCTFLPGPEAMQLATYAGWRLRGVGGGLLAGLLFVLPGAAVVLALSMAYAAWGDVPALEAVFLGIKSAVLVIVVEALLRIARRALTGAEAWGVAVAAFAGLFLFALPYPLIVAAAAAYGALRLTAATAETAPPPAVRWSRTLGTVAVWGAVWAVPLALVGPLTGWPILTEVGLFFSQLAVVTFGGAYAVLAYMAQEAVVAQGWLTAGEMLDGLGLAETTPGPLILVTQFVGYLAGHGQGGWSLGLAAAAVTLWATFAPCFLWIFAGAPYVDWIAGQRRLAGAMAGITAAVVGVIANLSLWFTLHVLFAEVARREAGPLTLWVPDPATLDPRVLALAALAAALLLWRRWGVAPTLGACALAGLAIAAL
ncbi:chromate efflux transporter [Rhodobacteraceae bacterium CCMM004]|nr:chromate efflux transporter [Rhodobacteraceae bacterium CCMM004]